MIFRVFLSHLRSVIRFRGTLSRELLTIVAWATGLTLFFGTLFYLVERTAQDITFLDAVWWSMVTMTTVGYGDFYAVTPVGRFIISYPCMILGIGLIGYLVGYIANAFIDLAAKKRRGLMTITEKDHIIICNYPGEEKILSLISELRAVDSNQKKRFVLITEKLEELPLELAKEGLLFVKGISTDEDILMQANVTECAGVIVCADDPNDIRSDARTFTTAALVEIIEKDVGRPIKTIAEVVSERSIRTCKRANVDGVISEEGLGGCLLAQEFVSPGINEVIGQLLTHKEGSQLYLSPTQVEGYEIRDLQIAALDHETDLQIIGLIRGDRRLLNPPRNTTLAKGDTLIVLANSESDLRVLEKEILSAQKSGKTYHITKE